MRPLTDHTPKPLLQVAGVPLIEHHIRRLSDCGVRELVVNVSHLADKIIGYCGDGSQWDVSITYSREETPLETAGGILNALPLLGPAPFLINGDVWSDYPLEQLTGYSLRPNESAHLVMVANPPQHAHGDFYLDANNWVRERAPDAPGLTYSGVGVYTSIFFSGVSPGKMPLRPLLNAAIEAETLGGEYFEGHWADVGTPERLQALDALVSVDS